MTVRSKLIYSYALALLSVLLVGAVSMTALLGWRDAAQGVERLYAQEVRSALLRGELMALISEGRASLEGDSTAVERFNLHEEQALNRLLDLTDSSLSEIESDHIVGLGETHTELVWIFGRLAGRQSGSGNERARERLDEISVEVVDDIAALNGFYAQRRSQRITLAENAGSDATLAIGGATGVTFVILMMVMVLTRRWLTKPALAISFATERISAGDFSVRLEQSSQDEWAKLARDINTMARSLEDLEHRLSERERMAALGEVAAFAAHNIRNPLAGIRAAAQVTAADYAGKDKVLCETLDEIIQNIDRLDVWVQRMMEFTRPLNVSLDRIDLNKIARDTGALTESAFHDKKISLQMDLALALPLIPADEALLEQALSAILNNAFQSAPQDGEVCMRTFKRVRDEIASAEITVTDNGPGVAPELRGRLFTLFASGKSDGSGLGLAQARRIVEAHGGEISVESPNDGGAIFSLSLPIENNTADSTH